MTLGPEQGYREIVQARTRAALDAAMTVREAWEAVLWTAAMHPGRSGAANLALMAHQGPGELLNSAGGWKVRGRCVLPGSSVRALAFAGLPAQRVRGADWMAPGAPRPAGSLGAFCVEQLYALGQTEPLAGADDVAPEVVVPPLLMRPERIEVAARRLLAELGAVAPGAEGAAGVLRALGRQVFAVHLGAGSLALERKAEADSVGYLAGLLLGAPNLAPPVLPRVEYGPPEDVHGPVRHVLSDVIRQGRDLAALVHRYSLA